MELRSRWAAGGAAGKRAEGCELAQNSHVDYRGHKRTTGASGGRSAGCGRGRGDVA